jgi:hypothetical protein
MQIYTVLTKNEDYSRGVDYTETSSKCNIFTKKELALKFAYDKAIELYKTYNGKDCEIKEPIFGETRYYLYFDIFSVKYVISINDSILDLKSDCILELNII